MSCTATNGAVACTDLACVSTSCTTGFADCNDSGVDGCEAALNTATNCGSCGNNCGTGACNGQGYCNAVSLGTGKYNYRQRMQGSNIYRLTVPANQYGIQPSYFLYRTPIGGGADIKMDEQVKQIGALTSDAESIYWGVGGTTAGLYKMALLAPEGTAPTPFCNLISLPLQMQIQGDSLYFMGANGNIYKRSMTAPLTDTGELLVSDFKGTGAASVYEQFAVTPTKMYWIVPTTGSNGLLRTASIAGGAASEVAGAIPRPWSTFAVSGEDIYYVQANGAAFDGIYHYAPGGSVAPVVAQSGLTDVTISGQTLYYVDASNRLYKVPVTGGTGTLIAGGAFGPLEFAGFDAQSTYAVGMWTQGSGFALAAIYKMPK